MSLLTTLTDFGDVALLMPLAALTLVWLLLIRAPHSAAWWVAAVVFCAGLTSLLKIYFYGCSPASGFPNPSGHTSLSILVYGAMTLVAATNCRGLLRTIVIVGGAGFLLAIAVSRFLLSTHSVPEIGLGCVIGTTALGIFALRYPPSRAGKVRLVSLLLVGGIFVLVLHGRELHAAQFLHEIGGYLPIHCHELAPPTILSSMTTMQNPLKGVPKMA
jgi:hypothetical protein